MKKLMIAACAVAFATGVQAATYNWNVKTDSGCGLTAATGVSTTGTAYLFNDHVDQVAMWTDLYATKGASWDTWAAMAEDTFSLNAGMVVKDEGKGYARVTSDYTKAKQNLFVVFKDGDNYFFDYAQEISGSTADSGAAYALDMSYAADYNFGNVAWQSESDYSGAGWYSTAAVPEPTSGLLLLLGVAGLALKRKRA